MNRLQYSPGAIVRKMQISKAKIHIFVEGGLDRSFADKVCRGIWGDTSPSVACIQAGREFLPAGGKKPLISFFSYLRRRRQLSGTFFGKPLHCVFLLDKDCDDYTRKKIRSAHVIYTDTYDLEGHLFFQGDLHQAASEACGITKLQAQALIPDQRLFLSSLARHWMDWTALCMLSTKLSVNCGCTYARSSAVNIGPNGEADGAAITQNINALALASGRPPADIARLFRLAREKIELSIDHGRPFSYFKGKWLTGVVQDHISAKLTVPDANKNGAGDRLLSCLVSHVGRDGACPSANYLRRELEGAYLHMA